MRTGFNTQPPEGGWFQIPSGARAAITFQHTAARRRLAKWSNLIKTVRWFQHTAARRRLDFRR
ncbi:hypothetical protein [Neisseria sicca]|uniref:hypothetical protein n=1 Tax=Neisseria sicca TaxID=490 RepID=UPI0039657381